VALLVGVALLVALLLRALVLALITGVEWYLNPKSNLCIVERRNLVQGLASAGQALAVLITGLVGLGGLFFTWRTTNQARKSTQRTLELTEQGQITERFTSAIELLGATNDGGGQESGAEVRSDPHPLSNRQRVQAARRVRHQHLGHLRAAECSAESGAREKGGEPWRKHLSRARR
jgi:hypothetical protein